MAKAVFFIEGKTWNGIEYDDKFQARQAALDALNNYKQVGMIASVLLVDEQWKYTGSIKQTYPIQ